MTSQQEYITIEKSSAPLFIRFGFVSLSTQWLTKRISIILFFLSHLQILALNIMSALYYIKNDFPDLYQVLFNIFKFVTFGDLLTFSQKSVWSFILYIFIFGESVHITLELIYILAKLKHKQMIPMTVKDDFGLMNSIRPHYEFLGIHYICLSIFKLWNDGNLNMFENDSSNRFLFGSSIFIFILNSLVSFSLEHFFSIHINKSDHYLSAKSTKYNDLLFCQKFLIPILWVLHNSENKWIEYLVFSLNLCLQLLRDTYAFKYLPFFRIPVMRRCVTFNAINTSAAIVFLFVRIGMNGGTISGLSTAFFTWLVLFPIAIKIYRGILNKVIFKITLQRPLHLSEDFIIHKPSIYKYWVENLKGLSSTQKKVDMGYYLVETLNKAMGLSSCLCKEEDRKLYFRKTRALLQLGVAKYPKSNVLKLFLADHYVRSEKAYLLASNILNKIKESSPSLTEELTVAWIVVQLEKRLYERYQDKEQTDTKSGLNMSEFISMNQMSYMLRVKIIDQIKCQADFLQHLLSNEPCMKHLNKFALQNKKIGDDIASHWKKFDDMINPLYKSPLFLYSTYQCLVNHSTDAEDILDRYYKIIFKNQKVIDADELSNNTMFGSEVAQIRVCGTRENLGKMVDMSQNVEQLLGYQKEFLVNKNIKTILPPYFSYHHDSYLIRHFETGRTCITNATHEVAALDKDGYLVPVYLHIKMNPLIESYINFVGLLKPIKEHESLMYVGYNGTIESMCRGVSSDLGFDKDYQDHKAIKIFKVCPVFRQINEAFNSKGLKEMEELRQKETDKLNLEQEIKNTFVKGEKLIGGGGEKSSQNAVNNQKELEKIKRKFGVLPKHSGDSSALESRHRLPSFTAIAAIAKAKRASVRFSQDLDEKELHDNYAARRALFQKKGTQFKLQNARDLSESSDRIAEMLDRYNKQRGRDSDTFSMDDISKSSSSYTQMPEEKIAEVCQSFEEGKKVVFYCFGESEQKKMFNSQFTGGSQRFRSFSTLSGGGAYSQSDDDLIPVKSIVYHCQISLRIDEDGFVKIIKLKKLSEQNLNVEFFRRSGTIRVVNPDLISKQTLNPEFQRNGTIFQGNTPSQSSFQSSQNNSPRFKSSRASSRSSLDSSYDQQLSEGVVVYEETKQPDPNTLQVPPSNLNSMIPATLHTFNTDQTQLENSMFSDLSDNGAFHDAKGDLNTDRPIIETPRSATSSNKTEEVNMEDSIVDHMEKFANLPEQFQNTHTTENNNNNHLFGSGNLSFSSLNPSNFNLDSYRNYMNNTNSHARMISTSDFDPLRTNRSQNENTDIPISTFRSNADSINPLMSMVKPAIHTPGNNNQNGNNKKKVTLKINDIEEDVYESTRQPQPAFQRKMHRKPTASPQKFLQNQKNENEKKKKKKKEKEKTDYESDDDEHADQLKKKKNKGEGENNNDNEVEDDDDDDKKKQANSLDLNESGNLDDIKFEMGQLKKNVARLAFEKDGSQPSTMNSRHKRIHQIVSESLDQNYNQPKFMIMGLIFIWIIVVAVAFGIFQTVKGVVSLRGMDDRSKALKYSILKVDAIVKGQREARLVQASSEQFYFLNSYQGDYNFLTSSTVFYLERLRDTNVNLIHELKQFSEFIRGRYFWSKVTLEGQKVNTFQASQVFIDKIGVFKQDLYTGSPFLHKDAKFMADTLLNDMMVVSEFDSEVAIEEVYRMIGKDRDVLLGTLIGFLVLVGLEFFGFLWYSTVMVKDEEKFANYLAKTDQKELLAHQYKLVQLQKFLDKNFQEGKLMNMVEKAEKESKGYAHAQLALRNKFLRHANLNKMNLRYVLMFLLVIPYLLVVCVWMILNHLSLNNHFVSQKRALTQMVVSIQHMINQSMANNLIIELVYLNSTTTVRNNPIRQELDQLVPNIGNTQHIIDQISDEEGKLTPLQKQIFFGIDCANVRTNLLEFTDQKTLSENCQEVSKNTGRVSLNNLAPELEQTIRNSIESFDSNRGSKPQLQQIFKEGTKIYASLMNVYRILLGYLYSETSKEFHRLNDDIITRTAAWGATVTFVALTFGLLTFHYVIKRLQSLEYERKWLLKILPIKSILTNRFIRTFLADHTTGFGSRMKHYQ